ncbi:MAG: M23 family metallopeptidase [candidate division WOR-3 bacterium]
MKKGISILISTTDARTSKHIFLSQRLLTLLSFIFIIIVILIVAGIFNYGSLSYRAMEATLLKRRNAEIEKEFAKLEKIKKDLALAELNNERIKIMLGIEKSPPQVEPEVGKNPAPNATEGVKEVSNIPYLFPTIGQISKSFTDGHPGIDIAAPILSPVIATASGKVVTVGWDTLYGNYIIIEHNKNYSTFFGHLNSITTKQGEEVAAGAVIGTVGSSGKSTSPHLHYEVRFQGKPVDPTAYLPSSLDKQ